MKEHLTVFQSLNFFKVSLPTWLSERVVDKECDVCQEHFSTLSSYQTHLASTTHRLKVERAEIEERGGPKAYYGIAQSNVGYQVNKFSFLTPLFWLVQIRYNSFSTKWEWGILLLFPDDAPERQLGSGLGSGQGFCAQAGSTLSKPCLSVTTRAGARAWHLNSKWPTLHPSTWPLFKNQQKKQNGTAIRYARE